MRVLWAPGALTLGKTHRPITLLTTPFSDLAPLTGHPFFQTARKQPHSTPDCQEAASPEQYTREPHKASGYQLLRQNCNLPGGPKKLCLHRPLGIPQTHRNPKTKRGGGLSSNRRRNCARFWQERLSTPVMPSRTVASVPECVRWAWGYYHACHLLDRPSLRTVQAQLCLRNILEAVCKAAPRSNLIKD
jgi:hypothetical protein